jgi:hypothetical protein
LVVIVAAAAMLTTFLAAPGWSAQRHRTTTTTQPPPAPGATPSQESNGVVDSWAVSPAGSLDPTQPGDRSFLSYAVTPGQQFKDAVILFNFSNVPLTFHLYPTDAFNNADGGFDVLPGSKKPKDVGNWITVDQGVLTLGPKTQATVPITVRIPLAATPGDHVGAILASNPATGTSPDGKVITVDRRTGTRVYVRVAGPLHPELAITKVHMTYHGSLNPLSGRTDVSYRVENVGNVRLAGKHHAKVSGILGLGSKSSKTQDLPELIPGSGATMHASFKGLPATFLNFATVTVDPNNSGGQTVKSVHRHVATIAMPWTLIALALVIYLTAYSRRAYRRHGDDNAGPPTERTALTRV